MNTWANALPRPETGDSPPSWETSAGLAAIAITLGLAVIAVLTLPGALVMPGIAVALLLGSTIPVLATYRAAPARRERARLFAAMLFGFGILAAALTDIDRLAALLR